MRRRASFGRRTTLPARPRTREYKARDANPSAVNVTPSSADRSGEDPVGAENPVTSCDLGIFVDQAAVRHFAGGGARNPAISRPGMQLPLRD